MAELVKGLAAKPDDIKSSPWDQKMEGEHLGGRGRWISEFETILLYRVLGQPGLHGETLSQDKQ